MAVDFATEVVARAKGAERVVVAAAVDVAAGPAAAGRVAGMAGATVDEMADAGTRFRSFAILQIG